MVLIMKCPTGSFSTLTLFVRDGEIRHRDGSPFTQGDAARFSYLRLIITKPRWSVSRIPGRAAYPIRLPGEDVEAHTVPVPEAWRD